MCLFFFSSPLQAKWLFFPRFRPDSSGGARPRLCRGQGKKTQNPAQQTKKYQNPKNPPRGSTSPPRRCVCLPLACFRWDAVSLAQHHFDLFHLLFTTSTVRVRTISSDYTRVSLCGSCIARASKRRRRYAYCFESNANLACHKEKKRAWQFSNHPTNG